MVETREAPFEGGPEQLRAVALSLNHPVVALEPLPHGPAVAAIVVPSAGSAVLVIRSQRSGALSYRVAREADAELAFGRALARAEGLGFLFEQERLAACPEPAAETWPAWLRDLFADAAGSGGPDAAADATPDLSGCLSKFRWAQLPRA